MEPGTLSLMGLGSVVNGIVAGFNGWQGRVQTKELEEKKLAAQEKLHQLSLEKQEAWHQQSLAMQQENLAMQQENLAFQRQRLQEEMKLQRELAVYTRQSQLLLAQEQRETALKVVEEQWRRAHWPLTLEPAYILGRYQNAIPHPLRIFFVPPEMNYDSVARQSANGNVLARMENSLWVELRKFLQNHYPIDSIRPVELMEGAWSSKQYFGFASIVTLHKMLQAEPTMVLELMNTNDTLHLNVAYWGISSDPQSKVLAEIPLYHVLQDSARKRVELLKRAQEQLLQRGDYDIVKHNRTIEENLKILEQNAKLREVGIDQFHEYKIDPSDINNAVRVIANVLCLVTAWFADVHHLFYTETPEKVLPLLPKLLSDILREPFVGDILRPLLPDFVATYHRLIEALKDEQPYSIPPLALGLAEGLSQLPEKLWAEEWMRYAMVTHLETLNIVNIRESKLLEAYLHYVEADNVNEVDILRRCLVNIGRHKEASELNLLEAYLRRQLVRKDDLNA